MAIWNFSKMTAAAILNLFEPEIAPLDPPSPKTPPYNQTWSGSDDRLWRYRHLKFFHHGGGRHLGFVRTVHSAVRYAVPENPPRTKHEVDRITRCRDMAIRVCWGIWNPHFLEGGGEVVGGSAMAPFERAMVVSYRLSIVTSRPQFAIECLQRSNQQGWVTLGPNLECSPWSRPVMLGLQRANVPG